MMPPHITAILSQWSDILNEADVSNEDAVAVAATMYGFVVINATAEPLAGAEDRAHELVDQSVDQVHDFITNNYIQILSRRRAQ